MRKVFNFLVLFVFAMFSYIVLAQALDPAAATPEPVVVNSTLVTVLSFLKSFDYNNIWDIVCNWGEILSQLSLAVMIFATILLRVIPKKYVGTIDGAVGTGLKYIHKLPTLGMNPRTKALEEALIEMRKQGPAAEVPTETTSSK